jgi:hypothetical protein
MFPTLYNFVSKVTIPIEANPDTLVWKNSVFGMLSFKDAFLFHGEVGQNLAWSKRTSSMCCLICLYMH